MFWGEFEAEGEGGELASLGGGGEDLRRNSERFFRISSREVTLGGLLEKDGFGKVDLVGCGGEVDCWCLRLALTSLK